MKQRGWCPMCRGPLFRPQRAIGGPLYCRLCWLESRRCDTGSQLRAFTDEAFRWGDRQDDANDTAASPATSQWLPRCHVHTWSHPDRSMGDVGTFLTLGNPNGDVVWFRRSEGIEIMAASTQLAKILRDEAADVAA